MNQRERTWGLIGIGLGSLMLLSGISQMLAGDTRGSDAYEAGKMFGFVFSLVMLGSGIYYFRKGSHKSEE